MYQSVICVHKCINVNYILNNRKTNLHKFICILKSSFEIVETLGKQYHYHFVQIAKSLLQCGVGCIKLEMYEKEMNRRQTPFYNLRKSSPVLLITKFSILGFNTRSEKLEDLCVVWEARVLFFFKCMGSISAFVIMVIFRCSWNGAFLNIFFIFKSFLF